MYFKLLSLLFTLFFGCSKEKFQNQSIISVICPLEDTISCAQQIQPILQINCLLCHQFPGIVGINLDTYVVTKSFAISGELDQSIIHDTNYVIMSPLPHNQ